ncbi:M61 family metallopeptidase [Halalkalibaculum roseum]|nr:PDZ domain-containing protein [Halalkalibaculum roseum]
MSTTFLMKQAILLILAAVYVTIGCGVQTNVDGNIRYDIRFPNAAHHEAEITLTITDLDAIPVKVSMSRTSPGRYALHEFAKNVYNVNAIDGEGDTLDIFQPDLHNWIVSGHNGTLKFSYTLYANHVDGTYSGVNEQHAHLNIPASLVWAQGTEMQNMTIAFHPPEGSNWKVATQLKSTEDPYVFTAPNFGYLMDSPTELSNFMLREWTVPADTTNYNIRLALHHNGTEKQADEYAEMAKKVVEEQIAVYGEPPSYDYGSYTFIADYLPYVYGDGMEHRNSTILTSQRSLEEGAMRNLYTLSHEYFHGWNVERIRPQSLEPFAFQEANVSGSLWFAEGFTSYYDDLIVRRAGLIDDREYGLGWGGTLNYVLNSPGNQFYSPVEMSMQAPFVDAATSVDDQNKENTFISYYSWGAVIGLGLDLKLRTEFENITLDDYMRAMWQTYGIPEKPYRLEDLKNTLAKVTGNRQFAQDFFDRHIYGSDMIELKPLFANAGFLLRNEFPGKAVISYGSERINFKAGRPTITENTLIGSPLYKAGIDQDDVLISLGGETITNARDLQRILNAHSPGDTLGVSYESVGERYDTTLVLVEDPTLELLPYEQAGMEVTEEMKTFRESWLGSKVTSDE